jgi:hypothetical protein
MNIRVRVLMDEGNFTKEILDDIHSEFSGAIKEELSQLPNPRETGDFAESWRSRRVTPNHTIIDNTSGKDTFLLGTGIWGPRGKPFCSKNKVMKFYWRAMGYQLFFRKCVKGINPEHIRIPGGEYNFPAEIQGAVDRGMRIAVRRLSE